MSSKKKIKQKVFAKGWCFSKIFIFFTLGCIIGTYWEEIFWYIRYHEITSRDGLIFGPFSPIYGVGVAIFILVLGKNNDKRSIIKTYLYSCLLGGFSEYLTSLIAEEVFKVSFWNYSNLFLNINGRTTIPIMLGWGLGGLIILKVIYPYLSKLIEKIPYNKVKIIFPIFVCLMFLDIFLTYSALGRMTLRNNNVKALTPIGKFYDKVFTDEYLYKKFPIMKKAK